MLRALGDAGISTGLLGEAPKPEYKIAWPTGLDETNPDIGEQICRWISVEFLRDFGVRCGSS